MHIAWPAIRAYFEKLPRPRSAVMGTLVMLILVYAVIAPPERLHEQGVSVRVERGAVIGDIAEKFGEAGVVKYPLVLETLVRATGRSTHIQAGLYHFAEPKTTLTVAYRLLTGTYGLPPARLTFIEGETARHLAEKVANVLPDIDAEQVRVLAEPEEGYLFPDTYFFPPSTDARDVVSTMRDNFDKHVDPLLDEIRASGHSLADIITMASIIEREAHDPEDRRLISGILWNRIERGMPLQVDAVFGYIFDRNTYSPSFDDLEVDSPYNTYRNKGLPPGPISNPGLDSIDAALHPTDTAYLYYLTGTDGLMHYATTYNGHKVNQRRYF